MPPDTMRGSSTMPSAATPNSCTYNYRTFHTAILEKFPSLGFKPGFDWAEALYNAIVSEHDYDYNLNLSEKAIQTGKELAKLINIRLRTLISPNVY